MIVKISILILYIYPPFANRHSVNYAEIYIDKPYKPEYDDTVSIYHPINKRSHKGVNTYE